MCLTIQVLMGCMYTSHFRVTRTVKAKYFYKFCSPKFYHRRAAKMSRYIITS